MKLAEQIFEYSYSVIDKRTCKVKRNVALLYLKSNRYDEALDVLKEVEELERTLYGEASTQLAKTYKVIGTLYIINSSPQEAREYLLRALGIFEAKGLIKLLKEVKSKLKMLNSSVKMAAEMAAQEAVEGGSGDDSGREGSPSGDRKQGSAGRSGNKRKFAMPNGVALAAALRAGQIGGAALDVLSVEPPPLDHPLLAADIPNLILTPHTAWASREARQRVLDEVAANIEAWTVGERRNRVV